MDCIECIGDTLVEGRAALCLLEQQLKDKNIFQPSNNDSFSVECKQKSRSSARRLLDQAPRGLRLQNRLDSPIGNLSDLDDRGLLDGGGGSVRSYYSSSSQQRSRRPLEMKKRSSRLLERGKEAATTISQSVFHMIRVLHRKGLHIEDWCQQRDVDETGKIQKCLFLSMLRSIGLPFNIKDINEIVLRYAIQPECELMNYDMFLSDAGLQFRDSEKTERDLIGDIDGSIQSDLGSYIRVLFDVKAMLVDTVESLGRQADDIYSMFARWDSDGSGTITATQFLRVLVRLHVDLTDQDQDFLVELLDTTSMGRIDFGSLLDYCFTGITGSAAATQGNKSPQYFIVSPDEVSCEDNRVISTEVSSVGSNNRTRRPHTASPSSRAHSPDHVSDSASDQRKPQGSDAPQRPITASARAGPYSEYKTIGNESRRHSRPESAFSDVPIDISTDEEIEGAMCSSMGERHQNNHGLQYGGYVNSDFDSNHCNASADQIVNNNGVKRTEYKHVIEEKIAEIRDVRDAVNLTNSRALAEPHVEESVFRNVIGDPISRHWENLDGTFGSSNEDVCYGRDSKRLRGLPDFDLRNGERDAYSRNGRQNSPSPTRSEFRFPSPIHELSVPLDKSSSHARQILVTVRDMVLERKYSGKSLREIFRHFDRSGKSLFNAKDFITATADLNIEITEIVAVSAISQIALDGKDNVSYGEFAVFILDPSHHLLESQIQQYLAEQLRRRGNAFQASFHSIFWEEDNFINTGTVSDESLTSGMVSKRAFVSSLIKLGLELSPTDIERLVTRFDTHGQKISCSATQFLRMVERSEVWKRAETVLVNQYVAEKEACVLRSELAIQQSSEGNSSRVNESIIDTAERLGIKAISEPHLMWIVREALNVVLPAQWVILKDSRGQSFYYNRGNNQSQWDHPLDSRFRQLRDQYRSLPRGYDRTLEVDRELSSMEYVIAPRGCDPPAPIRGSPSKLRAAVENAPLFYEEYEYEPQLLQYQLQQRQQQQHFQQQQLSQANTSNHISNSTYKGAMHNEVQSRGLSPPNVASNHHRSWVETALPSVTLVKATSRVADQNDKTAPSSSSNRIEIKPRAKSAAAMRRPGQTLPSSTYTSREKDQSRQSNPAIVFNRPSSGNDHLQNSKSRNASAYDYLGATSWSGARVSSANGTGNNIPVSKNANKLKLSESMIFAPNRRVYDQNRAQKELKRTSLCSSLTPVAPKESGRDEKLAFMYGEDVISRLDSIVVIRSDDIDQFNSRPRNDAVG